MREQAAEAQREMEAAAREFEEADRQYNAAKMLGLDSALTAVNLDADLFAHSRSDETASAAPLRGSGVLPLRPRLLLSLLPYSSILLWRGGLWMCEQTSVEGERG